MQLAAANPRRRPGRELKGRLRVQAVMGWTPPRRPWCARVVAFVTTEQEASVSEVTTIGLDLAKHVFQAHGADASGKVVFRKRLRREKVLEFFAGKPACLVAMEACSSAHHWARELTRLGHIVRLIPPAYVKPFREAAEERRRGCRSDLRGGAAADNAVRGGQERDGAGQRGCVPGAISWSDNGRRPS